jgi:hypothetical protein
VKLLATALAWLLAAASAFFGGIAIFGCAILAAFHDERKPVIGITAAWVALDFTEFLFGSPAGWQFNLKRNYPKIIA